MDQHTVECDGRSAVNRRTVPDRAFVFAGDVWHAIERLGRSRYAAGIGLLVLVAMTAYNNRHGARFDGVDFKSFYGAAQDLRTGRDPYTAALAFVHSYSASPSAALFATKAYVYAPIFAIFFLPLSFLSGSAALAVWDLLQIAFLVGIVVACLRIAGVRPAAGVVLLIAGAFALTQPVHKEWFLGQTDVFIGCVVACSVWARQARRPLLAGVLLGSACAVKPAFALLIPFLLWKREFRFALVGAASTLALYFAPFLFLGSRLLSDQLTVWRFWSSQFIAFIHNDSPDGVFVRLFTNNPVVRPLHAAPWIATLLWIAVVVIVVMLCASVVRRAPMRRDTATLLEFGLIVEAVLLITPLTEWPYLVMLTIPLVSIYCWCREVGPTRRGVAAMAAGLGVWVMLCGPAQVLEYSIDPLTSRHSVLADLAVIVAPFYLFTLIAAFAVQLVLVAQVRDVRLRSEVRATIIGAPRLVAEWGTDARAALLATLQRRPVVRPPDAGVREVETAGATGHGR